MVGGRGRTMWYWSVFYSWSNLILVMGWQKKRTSFLLATLAIYFSLSFIIACRSVLNLSFFSNYLGEYFLAHRLMISMIQMAERGVLDFWNGLSTLMTRDHIYKSGS